MSIAVVGLVADDDDVLLVAEFAACTPDHLVRCFERAPVLVPSHDALGGFAGLDLLAELKAVEVRDDDAGLVQFLEQVGREDVALLIVVLRVIWQ